MWESINSYLYDDRMFDFLAILSEIHLDPSVSDPRKIHTLPDDELSEGEARPRWSWPENQEHSSWAGLYKDVGIFTEDQWNMFMCKCVASMGTPLTFRILFTVNLRTSNPEIELADSGSLTTGRSVDQRARFEIGRLPKPTSRIREFRFAFGATYSLNSKQRRSPKSLYILWRQTARLLLLLPRQRLISLPSLPA
jgi:proteasome activator subunit 4